MRLLGIDYGSKRVGIALGNTETSLAFPKCVFENSQELLDKIGQLCINEGVSKIVIGESKDLSGNENLINEDIKGFALKLKDLLNMEVVFEPEFYSSLQASRIQGEGDMIDASAATIILQSYMDRIKNIENQNG